MARTRRRFLQGAIFTGAAVTLGATVLGCGSDAGAEPGPPPLGDGGTGTGGSCGETTSAIGSNHGHSLTVPAADVAAATDKDYDITGSSAHPHTVTITAAMFAELAATGSVTTTSTTDAGHSHGVTVTCA